MDHRLRNLNRRLTCWEMADSGQHDTFLATLEPAGIVRRLRRRIAGIRLALDHQGRNVQLGSNCDLRGDIVVL